MEAAIRLGALSRSDRARIEEIVRGSEVFSEEEVEVALEVFDARFEIRDSRLGTADSDVVGYSAPHLESRISNLDTADTSYQFIGAFTPDDHLVGYACYGATPGTEGTFDLYWIAVHPAAQSSGVGTILLREVERRLEELSARMLVVETSSRSDYSQTRGFYGRRGYAEAARVREFYAPEDDRIILTKRFHSPTVGGEQRHHE